jgi:NitT/TauT family transport system substrate-binding protein
MNRTTSHRARTLRNSPKKRTPLPLRKRIYSLLTLLALGLAAAAVSPALYAAEPLKSIDVSLGDVSINKVPFLIAADTGIYAKNGLEVHQYITPDAAEAAKGSGVIVPPEYINADIGKAPVVVGGGSPTMYRYINKPGAPLDIIVSTTEDIVRSHVVSKSSIASLEDLKGKRIGFTGTGTVTNYGTLAFLKKMGWKPGKDITLIDKASTVSALTQDRTDAIVGSAMVVARAKQKGFKDLGNLTDYNMPLAGSGIMVEHDWLAANRDTTARFVKSAIEATALMKHDRKIFNAALVKWFNIKDQATQDLMFEAAQEFPAKPYPSVEGIKGVMTMYDSPGMRSHKPEDFYDSSFIAALDKSGYLDQVDKK